MAADEESRSRTATPTDGKVTLSQVADRAGVSLTAASLALRGKPGIGDETRGRITAAANDLGYRLRSQPVDAQATAATTVGLLIKSRPGEVGTSNAFYGPVIAGVSEACAAAHLDVRIDAMAVDRHYNPIEIPRLISQRAASGLIILGATLPQSTAALVADWPVILVDGYAAEQGLFTTVVSDNIGGAKAATERLIEVGHTRVAMVGTTVDAYPSIRERRQGYDLAMAAAGLPTQYVDGHHAEIDEFARRAAATIRRDGITGVVAANDQFAIALIAELANIGMAVPDAVSVIGFDDIEAASLVRPRLDTVAIDKPAMGRLAVSLLQHRIAYPNDRAFTAVQHGRLIHRESVAPPR